MYYWQDKSHCDINKAVAEKHLSCGFRFDRLGRVHKGVDNHSNEKGIFNPCKSAQDAWPIILENKISLNWTGSYWCVSSPFHEVNFSIKVDSDTEVFRAAMIVYLEMSE